MNSGAKYGLDNDAIYQIISVLTENSKINEVILFGSRAKGNFRHGSDVDLSLIGKELQLNDVLNASIAIDDLSLPYKFDIVIYDRITEKALIDHINRSGIVLFDRNNPAV